MKILYIDIDTLRPDHLGCYGYHRNTSPNIDRISRDGVKFTQCFVSDAPCLPSRSALHHGRFGIHNGAINHGGSHADPYKEGAGRGFKNSYDYYKLVQVFQKARLYTCSISSFAGRHNSWWFLAGFNEVYDCGKSGAEIATEVTDKAINCLERFKDKDKWFLHFNIWDPHTPYRTPADYGNPFQDDPVSKWYTQELLDKHQNSYGPHSVNQMPGNPSKEPGNREVSRVKTLADYKKWIDGYDVGIKYADDAVGRLLGKLDELGLYEDTVIMLSSDHGENQGELNVYGDHQTADLITSKVPMIVKWPGLKAGVDNAFHYQFDIAATIVDLLKERIPGKWDAISFKDAFLKGKEDGRDYLVVSQSAWSCQRSVIFADYILIRTYMDGLKDFPGIMLFNRKNDPHELNDLSGSMPDKVNEGLALLGKWFDEQMEKADYKEDPMVKVIEEGGPLHTKGTLKTHLDYYKKIGRDDIAKKMEEKYKDIKGYNKIV